MSVVSDQAGVVGDWLARGRRVARAVLVAVDDSAPLPAGAAMFVTAEGEIEGSISGGCVESAVVHEATEVLDGAPPAVHSYGISDALAGTAGLTCGGTVHVFVHALDEDDAAAVAAVANAVRAGRPASLATVLDGPRAGATAALIPGGDARDDPAIAAPPAFREEAAALAATPARRADVVARGVLRGVPPLLARAVARDAAGLLDQGVTTIRCYGADGATLGADLRVFIRSFAPPPRLLIFGAIDFSAALAPLARELGYAVTISDPRRQFVTAPRFARAASVHVGWPDEAFAAGRDRFGPRDAILVFSHDPRLDVPALQRALATEAGYVGALGSRRTTVERNERLAAAGVTPVQLARLHAPCGLDIGGRTPEETAISILAEIVAVRAGRSSAPLRETAGSIQTRP
ncbi:XdhC family protein [Conexibacter sp. JD483]|uniref:XdhC family protein n=1 Tax=unclassified Conexibacter TaxID=2627773 RepID=UPI0027197CB5|nr:MULTISPECIES: XdhC/CoxI family protein [unclassified Conexibacter]MDO8186023.1 XdhC family protein [Conexibacter sp. CPCC 205706]MDO8199513.1 XdhC family protein [Conexibacter sp. CPCC 205762]MDR9368952.1 XdhC family protein [Conexibacter sp. JD483]